MNATTPNVDTIIQGDCLEEMKKLPDRSIDAIVTDPPYELAFMGKKWDASGIAYNVDMWGECLRVLKPGGHLLAFGGSRTYHRMACAIEDAGFIVHPMIAWVQGQGFPKATNLSKMLDKDNGAEREYLGPKVYADGTPGHVSDHEHEGWKRPWKSDPEHVKIIKGITAPSSPEAIQWDGWYYGRQSLKPAIEPIGMFQKPPEGRMVDNVRKWGCGAVNVDGCRIGPRDRTDYGLENSKRSKASCYGEPSESANFNSNLGRFPSNLIHDASPVVLAEFAKAGTTKSGAMKKEVPAYEGESTTGFLRGRSGPSNQHGDSGSVARFFQSCSFQEEDIPAFAYFAKASKSDRGEGNTHSTVKPTSLIQYLARLSCPPGGTILDPFAGSGTLAIAAIRENFNYILIEKEPEYIEICKSRIANELKRIGPKQLDLSESFKSDKIHI